MGGISLCCCHLYPHINLSTQIFILKKKCVLPIKIISINSKNTNCELYYTLTVERASLLLYSVIEKNKSTKEQRRKNEGGGEARWYHMISSVWATDFIPSFHGNMCCTCVPLALSQVTAQLGKTRREKNKPSGSSWSLRAGGAPDSGPSERSTGAFAAFASAQCDLQVVLSHLIMARASLNI